MRSTMTRAALLCAGLILGGAPLAAQQQQHAHAPRDTTSGRGMMSGGGMMRMMSMMMCPMMSAMMRGPAAALRARDTLHLSATQVSRLEALQRPIDQAHMRMMDSLRALQPRFRVIADTSQVDSSAVRSLFEQMARLHADVAVAMLRARNETAAILTPQQRASLAEIGRAHMGMAGMSAGADSAGCPMMAPGGPGQQQSGQEPDTLHGHQHGADTSMARP